MEKSKRRKDTMSKTPTRIFGTMLMCILATQLFAGLWHINNPFIDGTLHYNWSPPFLLIRAHIINDEGILKTFSGSGRDIAKDAVNLRHPPLTSLMSALWTQFAGYSEASIRILSLLLTILTTLFLALAIRRFLGNRFALMFTVLFASLPLIYIFGKKLGEETFVLLFLAFYLWGISFFKDRPRISIAITTAGALGMCLSDWSGFLFVFAGGIAAPIAWGWKENKLAVLRFIILTYIAALTGLFLYILEIYLQGRGNIISKYVDLYKYRADLSGPQNEWFNWFKRQFLYLRMNFTIALTVLGISGLFTSIFTSIKRAQRDNNAWIPSVFIFSILIAHLIYVLVVPQASFLHMYFQYYLSLPIAFGLTFLVFYIANRFKYSDRETIVRFLFVFTTLFAIANVVLTYDLMLFESRGDQSDIELIQSLRTIPSEQKIAAIDHPSNLAWFQGPNIQYYAGRSIQTYTVNEIQFSPYMIVNSFTVKDFINFVENNLATTDLSLTIKQLRCSAHICLFQILKNYP